MPNKWSQKNKRRTPKRQSPTGSNPSSHRFKTGCSKVTQTEAGCSEASYLELEAKRASPVPSREASEDHLEVASDRGIQDQGCFNFQPDQVDEVVRNPLQIELILGEDIAC